MDFCPDHLKDIIKYDFTGMNVPNMNWFNKCHFKGKLCYNSTTKFKIYFTGKIIDNFLVEKSNKAFVINVVPIETNKKITIFDERYHGYNALLIENLSGKKITKEIPFIDKDGKDIFEVIIWANYNIDFDDDYPNQNELELMNGKIESIENIKQNAFDSFGIIVKNELENIYDILELELA
jgi:hypothetical protein